MFLVAEGGWEDLAAMRHGVVIMRKTEGTSTGTTSESVENEMAAE